jgi:hypothetical protein
MDIGFIFWLIMLLAIIFYVGGWWGPYADHPYLPRFNGIWVFVLLFLLGWRIFGFIVRG